MVKARVVAEAVRELAAHIDAGGNKGVYAKDAPEHLQWVLTGDMKPFRDGILFYSTGHGWRVRKAPDWVTVFEQRFGHE